MIDGKQEEAMRYWCVHCNRQGVASLAEGAICLLCGEEQHEPFREGWDESD